MRIDPSEMSETVSRRQYETAEAVATPFGVPSAVKGLQAAHDRLHHQVGRLLDRLQPVLMPGEAAIVGSIGSVTPKREPSPLALELDRIAIDANGMADRLAEALDRLEL